MKRRYFVVSILTFLFILSVSPVMACNCGKKTDTGNQVSSCQDHGGGGCCSHEQSACSEKILEIKNTNCPVSGRTIGSMGKGATYTYKGKTYQLCCSGCIDQFKADPEKYIQKIEVNG